MSSQQQTPQKKSSSNQLNNNPQNQQSQNQSQSSSQSQNQINLIQNNQQLQNQQSDQNNKKNKQLPINIHLSLQNNPNNYLEKQNNLTPQYSIPYQKPGVPSQVKLPQMQFPDPNNPQFDFQAQACKLFQANIILTQLIKDHALDKYRLNQKIIKLTDQIKKLENKTNSILPK